MAELGQNHYENIMIEISDKYLRQVGSVKRKNTKHLEAFIKWFKHSGSPVRTEVKNSATLLKALGDVITAIYTGLESIVSDSNFDSIEENKNHLDEIKKQLLTQEFQRVKDLFKHHTSHLLNAPPRTGSAVPSDSDIRKKVKVKEVFRYTDKYLEEAFKLTEKYLAEKKQKKPKGYENALHKAGIGLANSIGVGKGKKFQFGKLALGGLSLGAAAFFKSSALGVPGAALLARRHSNNTKGIERYKASLNATRKYKNNIDTLLDKFEQDNKWRNINTSLSRFGAGTGKFRKAKRDGEVIVGDNKGGREAWGMVTKKGKHFGGVTHGVTRIGVPKGAKLFAKPLSGGGNTSINPSQFGAGTEESLPHESGELTSIARQQLSILTRMYQDNAFFHKDQISRADDLANKEGGPSATIADGAAGAGAELGKKIKEKGILGGIMSHLGDMVMTGVVARFAPTILGKMGTTGKFLGGLTGLGTGVAEAGAGAAASAGVGTVAKKAGGSILGKVLGAGGSRIPLLGGLISAGTTLATGGSKGEAIGGGVGSVVGGALGAVGGPVGMVIGSFAGEWIGKKLGGLFSKQNKDQDELQEAKKKGEEGFWAKLVSPDNPLVAGVKGAIQTAKTVVSNVWQGTKEKIVGSVMSGQRGKDLEQAAIANGITDPKELASFMGNMSHESGGFKSMSEGKYTADSVIRLRGAQLNKMGVSNDDIKAKFASGGSSAMYDLMYSDQYRSAGNKLGNDQAGDAEKYKGRGYTQLTGKANYAKYGQMLGIDLVNHPELAEDPAVAQKIAVLFWKNSGAGAKARNGDFVGARQAINGGQNGAADVNARTDQYLSAYQNGIPTTTNPMVATKNNVDYAAMQAKFIADQSANPVAYSTSPSGTPVAVNKNLAGTTPTGTSTTGGINTYNSNIQTSAAEIAQTKAASRNNVNNSNQNQQATVVANNTTVNNSSPQRPAPAPTVTTGDNSWTSLLFKGYAT